MGTVLRDFSSVFAAGAFGGLVNAIVVWLFGRSGISAAFGVNIAPGFTEQYLYSKIVWGGIWGIMFLLPFMKKSLFWRGVMYSIAPSLVMLFVVFPFWLKKGTMGLTLGAMVPLFVFLYNAFWGLGAALWIKLIEKGVGR